MAASHETYTLGDFTFSDRNTLPGAQIAYATYGELNQARDNAIVLPTWFVGTHADHEWMIGDGDGFVLDSSRYFVVVPSMFANGLSSSPSNTPAPLDRARFPRPTIADNVRAHHRLVTEHLGITGVELVIGGSMGAFQAFQWGLSHLDLVRRIMPTGGASTCSPHCRVFLEGVKAALLADPDYADGEYEAPPERGLRAVGRVYAGWGLSQAFYRQQLYKQMGFDTIDSFLVDFWEAFFVDLDANNLLSQLDTWQRADLAATEGYNGDLARALGDIRARAILAPGEKDLYFPPEDMAREAEQMPNAELAVIPGVWGHFSDSGVDEACNEFVRETAHRLLAIG
ncbi:MAG TPA: alpha/beta fold hydrolase [Solirubrobacterales bacterium]|nr:alpha/beta fold hydrolase [Solirubrobacterales bacterium]